MTRLILSPNLEFRVLFLRNLKHRLNLHRDIPRQRPHTHGAAGADAVLGAEDVAKQLTATVDDLRMVAKIRRAVHHAEHFDDALHAIEAAQFVPKRGEDRQASLTRGRFARFQVKILTHAPGHHCFVRLERAVAGDVGEVAASHQRFVHRNRFGRGREFQFQFGQAGFRIHKFFNHGLTRMDTDRKKRLLLENLFSPLLRLLSSVRDNRCNSCLLIRVHLCASVVLNQSTNINSFESSNTCAYFSQGLSGLGGGSGGPLKSFFAFHSPAYSPEEAPVGCSFDLMTGTHLKSSLLRLALKSTTKSIVSPLFTSVDSTFVSALSLCSVQLPNEPARLEIIRPRIPAPSLCSCWSVPLMETIASRGAIQRRIAACCKSFPAWPPSAVS